MDKTLRKSLEELNIQFITKNIWDKKVEHLKPEYCPKSREQPPCRKVKVQRISASENHPAAGQYGLFAAQNLNPGEVVLDYLGYVTSEEDADDSQYVAQLAPGVLVNAFKMGNEARFINDFRKHVSLSMHFKPVQIVSRWQSRWNQKESQCQVSASCR
mmetsp:Transcript_40138/g.62691  ORF Transcript_40138/g.62691 Transcript_40138/m.62691 type:complete len:158 (-) Transcript_40138:860-1333(-)